jgi:3-oxoacyl-[acyl-carrier protein] reductase
LGHLDERAGLAGKAAVVIGGGAGLGQATVDDLARSNVRVVVCDNDGDALTATRARSELEGTSVVTVEGDGRDPAVLDAVFERVDEAFGRLDILVNVVGGTFQQAFGESSPRGWDALIRTNFTWLLSATQLAIPRMRAAGGGSIVNFTSIEGHRAAPNFAVYAAMKAAVTNFSRTVAVELAPHGIRVNCVAADLVPTEGLAGISDLYREPRGSRAQIFVPLGRTGTYADVGGCVLFLASDLSSYVTGTTVHVDGGTYASSGWFNWPDTGWSNVPPTDVAESGMPR